MSHPLGSIYFAGNQLASRTPMNRGWWDGDCAQPTIDPAHKHYEFRHSGLDPENEPLTASFEVRPSS